MVVLDQYTRTIIGFSVQNLTYGGLDACRMFNEILSQSHGFPKYLVTDNDPVFAHSRWQANLRVADIEELRSIPGVPTSNPFVERVIGTTCREYLNKTLFWSKSDLESKLDGFKEYYNDSRVHYSLAGTTPTRFDRKLSQETVNLGDYRWKSHCNGMYSTPIAA